MNAPLQQQQPQPMAAPRSGRGEAPSAAHVVMIAEPTLGGVRRHLRRLIPILCAKHGHRIDVIISRHRAEPDFDTDLQCFCDHGCRIAVVPMCARADLLGNLRAGQMIRQHLRAWAPQIIHSHASVAGVVARLASCGLPRLVRIHSPHAFGNAGDRAGSVRRGTAELLEKSLARLTERYILVSAAELAAAQTITRLDQRQLVLAENGLPADFCQHLIPRQQARAMLDLPAEAVIIGVIGRLAPQKNHAWLLRAAAQPAAQHLHIACLGDGPERARLVQQAKALGLSDRLHWLGYRSAAERFLPAFDAVALPSKFEGLAYALLEALAADVPVVASDIAANHLGRQDLEAQVCYVRVDADAELAAALAAASGRSVGSSAIIREHFSIERQAALISACYNESRYALTSGANRAAAALC